MKYILVFISYFLFLSCNYVSESKRHKHIIDSLSRVEVPKHLDTVSFNNNTLNGEHVTITPQGVKTIQMMSRLYACRVETRHIDSLFLNVYEYDKKGRIVEHFREIAGYPGDGNAIGYRIRYDTLGNVSGYTRDIPEVSFDIYDIIELLQNENVNIIDSTYIRYCDKMNGLSNFWDVAVYYQRERKYIYTRYFDAQTGKIIKEWTEKIWTGR